jgi:ABC-type multidrug transport system fused ATPase/permease subunit
MLRFTMFKRQKANPICYLVKRMWSFGEGRRGAIVTSMVMSAIGMALWLTVPLVMARFIDAAQRAAESRDLRECAALLAATIGLGVLGWAFHGPCRVIEILSSFAVRRNIQLGLLGKATRLPLRWHQAHHSGETIDQVSRAASALADFTETASLILQIFARLVGAVVMMSIFMPTAGLVILANAALVVLVVTVFDWYLVPLYEEANKVLNRVASRIQDYLTNIRTVISLRLEDRVVEEVDAQLMKLRPVTQRAAILQEAKWFTANLLVDVTRALTLFGFVFGKVWAEEKVEFGPLFALNEYLLTIGHAFFELTWRWGDLVIKTTRLQAVEHLERDYDTLVANRAMTTLPEAWKELRLQNITFRHDGGVDEDDEVANGVFGVDLTLRRGKSYAVVGSSGSGKSTLLSLLRGLQTASVDSVRCDGILVPQGLIAVAKETTLVPQDPEVFADSVLKNVTMGIDAPREKVIAALEMAGFTDVLARLPRGLDTNIAEKGVSLSGGEKQRLALARGVFFAFDGESKVVLLDESTSGVDVVRERRIYERLLEHFSREVVVATTHKFNLLPLFDEIIVMERGRIVERGALSALIERGGRFATMWSEYAGSQATVRVAM